VESILSSINDETFEAIRNPRIESNEDLELYPFEEDKIYVAKFDGKYYRARCIEKLAVAGKLTVQFIDSGKVETVLAKELKESHLVSSFLTIIPPQVRHFGYYTLIPY